MIAFFGSYSGKVAFETESRSHRMISAAADRSASLTIGNAIGELEKVAAFVDRFGANQRIPQSAVNDLNICLDELLNNTISYGYDDRGMHNITLTLRLVGDLLTVELQDDGKPFDPTKVDTKVPEGTLQSRKVGGLGIYFVKALVDEVEYTRAGQLNVLTLKKRMKAG
jgi:serine/threonine-protein kinase RsbW